MLFSTAVSLRQALSRYAEAVLEDERHSTPESARVRKDRADALCAITGTTEVASAIHAATTVLGCAVQRPDSKQRLRAGRTPGVERARVSR
ncbi:DUF5133 domain-containing protein [Streptomyces longisporoflavus]|uniref:DUF5133 domain-containing protein n=1 Tax=Streptomyces longisporoflavus TaxID=28044 RepID=A0ABW7QQM2_9ACTN